MTAGAGTAGELNDTKEIDRELPLSSQVPDLVAQAQATANLLVREPAAPWVYAARLTAFEREAAFLGAMTEPSRRAVGGTLHLITSADPASVSRAEFKQLLRLATVDNNWCVCLGVARARDEAAHAILETSLRELKDQVGSMRLQIMVLADPLPCHAIVIDDLTLLSGADWLVSAGATESNPDFGFAIDSRSFAESVRSYFVGASLL
jgi:hypothetical protein